MPQQPSSAELAKKYGGILTPPSPQSDSSELAKQFGGNAQTPPPMPGISSQLLTTGLNTMGQAAKSTVQPVIHPLDFLSSIVNLPANVIKSHMDQGQKAWDAFQRGDRSEGVLRGLASIVPILGPITANYADSDQAGKEQIAGNLIGGIAQGRVLSGGRVPITPGIRSTNPVQAEANAFAQQHGIPLDAATATGNRAVSGLQHLADRSLGGAFIAPRAQAAQEAALTTTGRGLAQRVSPVSASPYQAGESIQTGVKASVGKYAGEANQAYDTLRQLEAQPQNIQKVTLRIPTTDAAGTTKMSTVTMEMGMPVSIRAAKGPLKPLYDRMVRQMPITQQQADPALHAIKNILDSPDYLPASMVDADLSAIKKLARSETGGRNVNQGMAAAAVSSLESQLQAAVTKAGPHAVAALKAGRAATVAKYGASELLESLQSEPVQVFNQATWRGDSGIDKLKAIAKETPGSLPKIGRAYLDDMLDSATAEGGFDKAKTLQSKWENLGPQTKALLFPDVTMRADLDNFFRVAKNIGSNPNPSGSGHLVSLGAQGVLTVTEPTTGIPVALTGAALSKLFHSPGGVRALTNGLSIPIGGKVPAALTTFATISRAMGDSK